MNFVITEVRGNDVVIGNSVWSKFLEIKDINQGIIEVTDMDQVELGMFYLIKIEVEVVMRPGVPFNYELEMLSSSCKPITYEFEAVLLEIETGTTC